jgi:nucleoside-diphosphate-sugar epimerase
LRRIAIIGASGFVGSTLTERLLTGEDELVACIHGSGNAWRIARLGIDLRPLDLLDAKQVEAALRGVTHVVNCARGDDDVMLAGLRNLLGASVKNRVERFVHLGSVAVYGDPPPPQSVHEAAPTLAARGTYGFVKLQQDRMVTRACAAGLPGVILCPPNISGPHSSYLIGLVDALRGGAFALLDDGEAPCNLVDVSNLSHAIELALHDGPADGSRVFVTDDEPTDWRCVIDHLLPLCERSDPVPTVRRDELASMGGAADKPRASLSRSLRHLASSEVRQALRKDPLWARLDGLLRRGVARMGTPIESALRTSIEGPIRIDTIGSARRFNVRLCQQQLRGVRHSSELARTRLGYRPVYSVAQSMAAFRAWYRGHHGMDSDAWPLLRQLQEA